MGVRTQTGHYFCAPEWLETPEGKPPRPGDLVVLWRDSLGNGQMKLTGVRYVEVDGQGWLQFVPPAPPLVPDDPIP